MSTRNIPMKFLFIFMLFSGVVKAVTVNQLIDKYGKREITEVILKKTKGKLTILRDGQTKEAHMPSLDYVNAITIKIDLASIGLTPKQVETIFLDKIKMEKEKKLKRKKNEEKIRIAHEKRLAKLAKWAKEDSLRKKDKYDLEVALAVQRGNKIHNSLSAKKQVKQINQLRNTSALKTNSNNIISDRCSNKWGNNYRMVEYCVNQQQTALRNLNRRSINIPTEISSRCSNKWGNNYRMVEHCVNEQQAALKNLNRSSNNIPTEINSHCSNKWGNNYRMVEYCVNQQQTALRNLQNIDVHRYR